MAYKQNFKSPILKALVGKQGNLPQHLQDAIKAAPESPAKMKDLSGDGKVTKKDVLIGRGVLDKDGSPAKNTEPTIVRRKDPNAKTKAPKRAKAGKTVKGGNVYAGAKETTQQRKRLKKEVDSATTSSGKKAANKKLRMAEKQQRAYDKQKSRNASLEKRAKSLDGGNKVDQGKAADLRSRKVANNKAINVSKPVGKNKAVVSVKKRPKLDSPAKQSVPGFNKNSKAAKNAAARRKTKTSIPPSLGGSATKAAIDLVKKGVKNQKDVFGRAGYDVKSSAKLATEPKKKAAKTKKVGNRTYTIATGLTKGKGKFKKK